MRVVTYSYAPSYVPTKIKGAIKSIFSKELILVLFLTAGYFKGDERLSSLFAVDLTVLFAALVIVAIIANTIKKGYLLGNNYESEGLWLLLALYMLFLPVLLWTEYTIYAISKAERFFTLTLLATIAPYFIITNIDSLRRFLILIICEGGVIAGDSLLKLLTNTGDLNRLSAFSGSTIATGRAIGLSILALVIVGVSQKGKKRIYYVAIIGIVLALILALVATGARGPLVFALISIFVIMLVAGKKNIIPVIVGIGLLGFLAINTIGRLLDILPDWSLDRVSRFFQTDFGDSELERLELIKVAIRAIPDYPFGLGLGGFAKLESVGMNDDRPFAHNILLEVCLEGGWLCFVWFLYLIGKGFHKTYHLIKLDNGNMLFKIQYIFLAYLLLNDMVSGELTDSRLFFSFLGLAVSYKHSSDSVTNEFKN